LGQSQLSDVGHGFFCAALTVRFQMGKIDNGDLADWQKPLTSKRGRPTSLPRACRWAAVTRSIPSSSPRQSSTSLWLSARSSAASLGCQPGFSAWEDSIMIVFPAQTPSDWCGQAQQTSASMIASASISSGQKAAGLIDHPPQVSDRWPFGNLVSSSRPLQRALQRGEY